MFIIIKIIIETLPKAQRTHARHWVLWLIIHLSKGKLVWQDCGGIREPYCKFSKSMITPIGNMIITIITMIRWHRGLPAGKKPLTNLKFSIPTTLGRGSSGWEAQAGRQYNVSYKISHHTTTIQHRNNHTQYNTDTITQQPYNTNIQQAQVLHFFCAKKCNDILLFLSKLLQQNTKICYHQIYDGKMQQMTRQTTLKVTRISSQSGNSWPT